MTELKERDNEVSYLAAANGGLQRKVDAADAKITEMKVGYVQYLVVYRGDHHQNLCTLSYTHTI